MRLLIVRHGESTYNAEQRWQGRADPPLSPAGQEQAHRAAEAIVEFGPFDRVLSSPLIRARTTAETLGEAVGRAVELDADLVERAAGPWEGLTRPEIEQGWPGMLASGARPPGYEDDTSVLRRAHSALERLVPTGGTVLVVCHGGLIGTLERSLGLEREPIANLAGRWFTHQGELVAQGARIRLAEADGEASGPGYV